MSPDEGSAKRSTMIANYLGETFIIFLKIGYLIYIFMFVHIGLYNHMTIFWKLSIGPWQVMGYLT